MNYKEIYEQFNEPIQKIMELMTPKKTCVILAWVYGGTEKGWSSFLGQKLLTTS